jgi:hypothetical protein
VRKEPECPDETFYAGSIARFWLGPNAPILKWLRWGRSLTNGLHAWVLCRRPAGKGCSVNLIKAVGLTEIDRTDDTRSLHY